MTDILYREKRQPAEITYREECDSNSLCSSSKPSLPGTVPRQQKIIFQVAAIGEKSILKLIWGGIEGFEFIIKTLFKKEGGVVY